MNSARAWPHPYATCGPFPDRAIRWKKKKKSLATTSVDNHKYGNCSKKKGIIHY